MRTGERRLTLLNMKAGDKVMMSLEHISESTIRSTATRIHKTHGRVFHIVREFPNLIVTRIV